MVIEEVTGLNYLVVGVAGIFEITEYLEQNNTLGAVTTPKQLEESLENIEKDLLLEDETKKRYIEQVKNQIKTAIRYKKEVRG